MEPKRLGCKGQREVELSPFSRSAFDNKGSPMQLNEPFRNGESKAGSRRMSSTRLDPIELVKDSWQMLIRDAAAGIRHVYLNMPIVQDLCTDMDTAA